MLTAKQIEQALSTPRAKRHFKLGDVSFPKQLEFCRDRSRQQTAVCTRRAGKTYGCGLKLLLTAMEVPGATALYITLSRLNAKRIMWETLKELNAVLDLGGKVGEADLAISFDNGSRIYLSGAADASEVDKFRGLELSVVVVDEAQSFPSYLQKLVDEVLAPALMDRAGSVALVGTPGPVPLGYFHDCVVNPNWSHHAWSAKENAFIEKKAGKPFEALLQEELQRRGVAVDDPVIQREWFARWVLDTNALVFKYDSARNNFETLPELNDYVIGVDLGFDDADAIAVLGWGPGTPDLFLVEEWVAPKQSISALAAAVKERWEKYKPHTVVADFGGLGKKIADEVTSRTQVPLEAAEKERKLEHIELLNDSMRTGHFFAPKSSRFAQDCHLVEWDRSNPEKPKISDRFHSDICDAVLYAYRQAQHWLWEAPKKKAPAVNSPEWLEAERRALEEQFEAQLEQNKANQRGEFGGGGSEDMLRWIG
jgi:hypothetical protein